MERKKYIHPEYFAQQFRNFLRGEGEYAANKKRGGGKWPAEQHGNCVLFSIYKEDYALSFKKSKNNNKIIATLEKKVEGRYVHVKTIEEEPERSKTGRLSPNYPKSLLAKLLTNSK